MGSQTHNHGTESDDSFHHTNGNEENKKGFGHIGFLVDDVYEKCKELEEAVGLDFSVVSCLPDDSDGESCYDHHREEQFGNIASQSNHI
mgnify:CR=1 FL=1